MAVRIYIEIGHEASIRTKKTQEGFTHDWEVFVRGCDGAEIHYYIEKVVFYLHETFQKPKRVIKEPPYSVKESGYAGFNLPIDIYLRNNGEPKKIRFNYDLHLQQSGPPIIKVQKEKYVFTSPTEEFKIKLIKGGGTISSSSIVQEVSDNKSSVDDKNQMINKPKLGGCDQMKKQKIKTGEPCRDFQELFGSPIFTTTKTVEQKPPQSKQDHKSIEKSRTKYSPHKDKEKSLKEKGDSDKKNREEKKSRDKGRDRERSKDKSIKKEKSPRPKSPSPKRSPKRPSTPPRFSSPTALKHKESKQHDKDKRDKLDEKKSKKDKRNKEHRESKHGDEQSKRNLANEEHREKDSKLKGDSKKDINKNTSSPPLKNNEQRDKSKEKSSSKETKDEKNIDKAHSEKYKHKKRDKEKRDKKEEKSRNSKPEKKVEKPLNIDSKMNLFKNEHSLMPKKEKTSPYLIPAPPPIDDDSSNSSSSSASEKSLPEKKIKTEIPKIKEEKNQKTKKERGYQDTGIKCKRKSDSIDVEEPSEKIHREQNLNNNSDLETDSKGKIILNTTKKEEEDNYFSVLRELQHKIMGLKDNSDLQKVVQLIAETGRYEVSAHTFDFDLCLLDRSTVQQLQEFFANNDT